MKTSGKKTAVDTSTYVEYAVEGLMTVSLYVKAESGKRGKDKVREAVLEAIHNALVDLSSTGEANVDEYQSLDIEVQE